MKVKDVMRKATGTLPQNASLNEVIRTFLRHRVDFLSIVDAAERAVGIVTIHDLIDLFMPRYHDLLRDFSVLDDTGQLTAILDPSLGGWEPTTNHLIIAADLVHTNGPWISEEEPLLSAAARLQSSRQNRLPVVDKDNRLVGILYDYDIVLTLLQGYSGAPSVRTTASR